MLDRTYAKLEDLGLDKLPEAVENRHHRANLSFDRGEPALARAERFEQLVALSEAVNGTWSSAHGDVLRDASRDAVLSGDYPRANDYAERSLATRVVIGDENLYSSFLALAETILRQDQLDELDRALVHTECALELALGPEEQSEGLHTRALILVSKAESDGLTRPEVHGLLLDALDQTNAALALNPGRERKNYFHLTRAQINIQLGRYAAAIDDFSVALKAAEKVFPVEELRGHWENYLRALVCNDEVLRAKRELGKIRAAHFPDSNNPSLSTLEAVLVSPRCDDG